MSPFGTGIGSDFLRHRQDGGEAAGLGWVRAGFPADVESGNIPVQEEGVFTAEVTEEFGESAQIDSASGFGRVALREGEDDFSIRPRADSTA